MKRSTRARSAKVYFASGLIYGGQMLLQAAQALGGFRNRPLLGLLIGLGPTVLFIPAIDLRRVAQQRDRKTGAIGPRDRRRVRRGRRGQLFLVARDRHGRPAREEPDHLADLSLLRIHAAGRGLAVHLCDAPKGLVLFVAAGWFALRDRHGAVHHRQAIFVLFAGVGLWLLHGAARLDDDAPARQAA